MSSSRSGKDLPSPEDLLSGKVQASVRDLFELIHRINPSGRRMAGESKGDAYATKAALQSLLIEDYAEELLFEPMEEKGEAVIGIRHRFLPLDACHAIVSQLSSEARAWVFRDLDAGEGEDPTHDWEAKEKKAKMRNGLEKLLEKGDKALAQFDFPLAAESYEKVLRRAQAWKEEGFYQDAAKRFLVLMVDHWVDDERVLEFVKELPEELASREDFCAIFAASLVRLGEIRFPKVADALCWLRQRPKKQ